MPDTYLRIIPVDPVCVPSALARERALGVLRRAAPLADDIASQVTEEVRFVDCGTNLRRSAVRSAALMLASGGRW